MNISNILILYKGVQVGIVVGMPMSGALAEGFGWETVFYTFGGLGLAWFVVWGVLIQTDYFVSESTRPVQESTFQYHRGITNCYHILWRNKHHPKP